MSKWEMVKLSDMFNLQMGKTPSRDNPDYWNGNKKWVSISDLGKSSKYISNTKECITDIAVSETGIKITPKDTVIMSFKLSIGKTAITVEDIYTNEAIMSFIDNGIYEFDVDYIYYLFSGKDWNEGTNKAVMGITLNKATLSQIKIPLPPLEIQKQIAENLDKVTRTIDLCNQIIEKLDLLVKARFVEMFGDIDKIQTMSDVCSIITDGTHQPPQFTKSGIPFLFVSNIVTNEIIYNAEKFISDDTYNELYKRTPIEIGDIVLSTVGSYGHPAVVKTDKKFLFQRHIAYLKPIKSVVNSTYLHSAILSEKVQEQIEDKVKGVAQKTLNLSEIRKIKIIVPPIDLQEQFADFVKQTDKSKSAINQLLEKAETLKKALIQEYFG